MAEKHSYLKLVKHVNDFIERADLESCFQRLREYVPMNFEGLDMNNKYQEVVHLIGSHSRINTDKRRGIIGYAEYNQELRVITKNLQDFVGALKPNDVDIDLKSAFLEVDAKSAVWNNDDNLVASLVFPNDFGLLAREFDRFKASKKEESSIRVDTYFFDGTRKIPLEKNNLETLDPDERSRLVFEEMAWHDAVIFQKRDSDEAVLSEALVLKKADKEEILVRTNGIKAEHKREIMVEVFHWFRTSGRYPEKMREPFSILIPFPSISIFE